MKKLTQTFTLVASMAMLMTSCATEKAPDNTMQDFGKQYTDAWNSQVPEKMAALYAEDGTLTINGGTPAKGREQLAATAQSFMEAFPDLKLTMDSLVKESGSYQYYWTFEGTHTGPGGSGNEVLFSGFEEWTMNGDGLIQTSIGTFDAEDYARQLNAPNRSAE